jgi:hypothetical protein
MSVEATLAVESAGHTRGVIAPARRPLRGDERGAILVIGVFMAAFLAGVLLHAVELGRTIVLRERLQDGADAGAFSAAVTCARGMNVIVLANLIMAALLAILVALRVIEMLATLAIAVLAGLAWFGGATAAAIPPVMTVRQNVRQLHQTLKDPVFSALKALRTTSRVVQKAVPVAAQGSVLDLSREYAPAVAFAFAIPSRLDLPVEDDSFDVLCEKAGELVGDLVLRPLSPVLPGAVRSTVSDAAGELARSASDWFCGKSGASAPTLKRRVKVVLPRLPERDACERHLAERDDPQDPGPCADLDELEGPAAPDARGECVQDCRLGGPYDRRATLAREQCDPARVAGRLLTDFAWQEQKVNVVVEKRDGVWVERSRTPLGRPVLIERSAGDRTHPCGSEDALYSPAWNSRMHPPGSEETLPVCVEPWEPPALGDGPVSIETVEVLNVFRCSYTKEVNIAASSDFDGDRERRAAAAGSREYSPQKVEDGVALGDEDFMLRIVALPPAAARRGDPVRVAVWGEDSGAAPSLPFPRLAIAQAEYFFDGVEDRAAWMWQMKWRARLHRVRWPQRRDEPGPNGAPTDAAVAGACTDRGGEDAAACPPQGDLQGVLSWMAH